MMSRRRLLLVPVVLLFAAVLSGPTRGVAEENDSAKSPSRIMFGSCARQDQPQPIWNSIVAADPDLFLFIGDNIYGDSRDIDVLRAKYEQLLDKPGFKELRKTCKVLATWDDHDYGENDAGAEYPVKAASQKLFNDVFDVPADSPRRKRPGIYDAHIFGPRGRRVQVILLDTRYFRDKLRAWAPKERPAGRGPYRPHEADNRDVTLLGAPQWKWLEKQLEKPAELRIIASSIQVVPYEHGWESWGNFPAERKRLFDLIADTQAEGVIFISGDRHLAEICRIAPQDSGVPYPLYDVTSSSLNQPGSGANDDEPNRFRVGDNYLKINFGSITIDWQQDDPIVTLGIHGGDGEIVRAHELKLSRLD